VSCPTPTPTWCQTAVVPLDVHSACAALDWLCARTLGPAERPTWWTYPVPALARVRVSRHTQVGPPERERYAPYRRLHAVLCRTCSPTLGMELEVYPWDRQRVELLVRPRPSMFTSLPLFAAVADRLVTDLARRLVGVRRLRSDTDLDAAALELLLAPT